MAQIGGSIIVALAIAAFTVFATRLVANRRHVSQLQAMALPMPKYHPIFGHLVAMRQSAQSLPKNSTVHVVISQISKRFPTGIFYLNLWPFSRTIVVVTNPFAASQVEAAFLDKPDGICATMNTINGGPSLMSMRGAVWKKWRGIFNPGFAAGYIGGLAPAIADEVVVFCKLLEALAKKGEIFQLEEYTLRLTFDVITRVTLDARLHYQTQGNLFADCLRRQISWTPYSTTLNPFRFLSPRWLVQKYNNYHMDRYLDEEIDKRFQELDHRKDDSAEPQPWSKSVISLAMDQYLEDEENRGESSRKVFKKLVKPQLRMFLYAGNDTTSSTLLYCYYLLSRNPLEMSKLRAEHDEVFGPDSSPGSCNRSIAADPTLLNRLPYTLAVIKEVLRIFPPAGSSREGRSNLVLTDEEGRQYPTEGCNIFTLNLAMHHSPRNFVDPDKFIPQRWLANPQDPLYPKKKGSWRAFEWGTRSCIGQTLAQLEMKIALVMTARMFDVTPSYNEWDELHPRKGVKLVDGNRVYQAEMGGGGAHPADGFPVKVAMRM